MLGVLHRYQHTHRHTSACTVKTLLQKRHADQASLEGNLEKVQRTYQNAFTGPLLLAARTFETDKGPADKAEGGVFWHLFASSAGLPVIVLEDDVVVVRQLEETRRHPLVVLHEQGLYREEVTEGGVSTMGPVTSIFVF